MPQHVSLHVEDSKTGASFYLETRVETDKRIYSPEKYLKKSANICAEIPVSIPNSIFYSSRSEHRLNLKDYEGAISDLDKAIGANPEYGYGYLNRGVAKSQLKDYNGAMSDFDKGFKIIEEKSKKTPDDFLTLFALYKAYACRGDIKRKSGDPAGALSDFNKAFGLLEQTVKSNPEYSKRCELNFNQLNLLRGIAKNKLKDYSGAIEDLEKALLYFEKQLIANPEDQATRSAVAEALRRLSVACRRLGMKEKAKENIRKSREIAKN